jgi:hypothetical protein
MMKLFQTHDRHLRTHLTRFLVDGTGNIHKQVSSELPSFVFYVLLVPLYHMFYHQSPGVPYMPLNG